MKPATGISVDVPETLIQPTKTGAFIKDKLKHFKSAAMAAIAALGLASSVEASQKTV